MCYVSLLLFHDLFVWFWIVNRKCITETKREKSLGKRNAEMNWNCRWICWYFETFETFLRDRNILVRFISSLCALYWHHFTVRFTKKKNKKNYKKKLNERIKNKTFKRTKSWKLITVNCEWNIVTQKKIVIFVKTKMRNLAATAMTFYMTKKATCIGCLTLTFLFQVKLPSLFTKSSQEIPAGSCDIVISSAC